MRGFLRKILFSKQFFAILVVVLAVDLTTDIAELLRPGQQETLNKFTIGLDIVALSLALWMFIDLSLKRGPNGDHSRRR